LFYAGTIFFSRRTGIVAAILMAVSQLAIMYSQELRCYAQQIFLITAFLVFLGLALRYQISWAWWCAVLTAILAEYTHYYSIFAMGPLLIWAAFGRYKVSVSKVAGGLMIAFVLFLPWMFSGIFEAATSGLKTIVGGQPSYFSVSWATIFDTFNRFNNGGVNGVLISGPPWAFFVGAFLFGAPVVSVAIGGRPSVLAWAIGLFLVVLFSVATGDEKPGVALVMLFTARVVLASCRRLVIAGTSIYRIASSPHVWVGLLLLAFLVCLHQESPRWVLFTLGLMLGVITHNELLGNAVKVPNPSAPGTWNFESAHIGLPALFLLISFLVGVAIPVGLGAFGIQYDPRYTLSALPIYYILVAEGISRIKPKVGRYALVATACVYSVFALRANYFFPYKENWRDSMALVVTSYETNDCVTMAPWGDEPFNTWYAYRFEKKLPNMRYVPVSRVVEEAASCPRLWFMEYRRVRVAFKAAESLRVEVEKQYALVNAWSFHWVDVYLYTNQKGRAHKP